MEKCKKCPDVECSEGVCRVCAMKEVSRLEAENKELEYHFELMADTIEDYQAALKAKDEEFKRLQDSLWKSPKELFEEPGQEKAEVLRGGSHLPSVGRTTAPETPVPSEEGFVTKSDANADWEDVARGLAASDKEGKKITVPDRPEKYGVGE